MNTLISRNSFQFHHMQRQLIDSGGIRKILPDSNKKRKALEQEETHLTKVQPKTTSTAADRRQPFQNDVICARGRTYWDHPGNQLYRKLISLAKSQYSKAPNRLGKSLIVSEIIRHIHQANGRFTKKVKRKGDEKWVECNLNFVREKVTQSLRDGLSFKYSSSTERKRQRKAQSQEIFHDDIDRIVQSNPSVSQKVDDFKQKVKWMNRYRNTEGEGVSDETVLKIFGAANLDILETMKKDPSMIDQLNRATSNGTQAKKKKNGKGSARSLSPPTNSLTSPLTMLLQSKSAPQSLLSTHPSNTLTYVNNTIRIESSVSPNFRSGTEFHIRAQENKNNNSSDHMDLDLESPFMFLDEITRRRA